jgi:hypothetical protein
MQVVMKPLEEIFSTGTGTEESLVKEALDNQEPIVEESVTEDVATGPTVIIKSELVRSEGLVDDVSGTDDGKGESEKDASILVACRKVNEYPVNSGGELLIMAESVKIVGESSQVIDSSTETGVNVDKDEEGVILGEPESNTVQVGDMEYTQDQFVVGTSEPVVVTSSPVVTVTSDPDENLELFINRQSDTDTAQDSENEPKGKTRTVYKKKYAKADFTNLPKIFNCQYCTMRFSKLINLYKHIHGQHASIHPVPPEGNYACVVCDFRTPQKKVLLIHMRRHNPESDQEEMPNMIYSCVLCQYCTPKRRNLYWHLKKKHKINLLVNKDGTAKCVVDENGPVSIVSAPKEDGAVDMDGQQVALSVEEPRGSSITKVVNVSDLAHSLIQPKVTPPGGEVQETVEVVLNDIKIEECVVVADDDDAAVAIEGLQALAEQTIKTQSEFVVCESGAAAELDIDTDRQNIELSSEQVMQLSSGDYIEIDGEMYKVEFGPDDSEETVANLKNK